MALDEVILIVGNRLNALQAQRTLAVAAGELARVAALDADIAETTTTLDQLRTLTG
jgi:hypothetical protein